LEQRPVEMFGIVPLLWEIEKEDFSSLLPLPKVCFVAKGLSIFTTHVLEIKIR
jgi:hypothetical protein